MQSKQSREEDAAAAARLQLFQVLMSFSLGSVKNTHRHRHRPQISVEETLQAAEQAMTRWETFSLKSDWIFSNSII